MNSSDKGLPARVLLIDAEAELLRRLHGRNGPSMFHKSGGCCNGFSPILCPVEASDITKASRKAGAVRQDGLAVGLCDHIGPGHSPPQSLLLSVVAKPKIETGT